MSLPAAPKSRDLDATLKAAASVLGVPPAKLISIKIRPIEAVGGVKTDHIWPSDYVDLIDKAFADAGVDTPNGIPDQHSVPIVGVLKGGHKIVYVKHESGPEIIAFVDMLYQGAVATGAAALAANQVLKLVNNLNNLVRQAPSKTKRGKKPVGPTSIERRTTTGQKVLKQIAETAKSVGKAIKSVKELFT